MADSPITKQSLVDAQSDADTLAAVINGPIGGLVPTRYGPVVPTLAEAIQRVQNPDGTVIGELQDQIDLLAGSLDAKADKALQLHVGGLVTGGGGLDSDRTFTVTAASEAEAQAGVAEGVVLTPLGGAQLVKQQLLNRGLDFSNDSNYGDVLVDANGNPVLGARRGDVHTAFAGPSAHIATLYDDAMAMALSLCRKHGLPNTQLFRAKMLLFATTGQSFDVGLKASYALSLTAHIGPDGNPDVFTLGLAGRAASSVSPTWVPQGGPYVGGQDILTSAVATVDWPSSPDIGAVPATQTQIASLYIAGFASTPISIAAGPGGQLLWLAGTPVGLVKVGLSVVIPNGSPTFSGKDLHGTYLVTAVASDRITLSSPASVNSNWSTVAATTAYVVVNLSAADVVSFAAGEMMINQATNAFATMWNADPRNEGKLFVIACAGVGGQTIEQLSKNANATYYNPALPGVTYPDIFNRWVGILDNFVAQADLRGLSRAVPVVFFEQGQANYDPTQGGTQDRATYKARLKQYISDVNELIRTKTGQTLDPLWVFNQTSGNWLNDTFNLSISMAQLELCWENPGLYTMAGPTYDVTDNRDLGDAHLSANGYRWVGERWARALWRVAVEGYIWEPVAPIKVTAINEGDEGGAVYVTYSAPFPPLQFVDPFNGLSRQFYSDQGYRVFDSQGEPEVLFVQQITAMTFKVVTERALDLSTVVVKMGDDTQHNGNACTADSCRQQSYSAYTYLDSTTQNMPPAHSIAELNDKPYPSVNPACLWYIQLDTNGAWKRT